MKRASLDGSGPGLGSVKWSKVTWTPTMQRFAAVYCRVSGWFVERGPMNVVFLVRPGWSAAGFFTGHVVALVTTSTGRERLRFEPCGSFTVRRNERIDLCLVGALAGILSERIEAASAGPELADRQVFYQKLKASELEFERLR